MPEHPVDLDDSVFGAPPAEAERTAYVPSLRWEASIGGGIGPYPLCVFPLS